jgi:hypothetical protein
VGMPVLAKFDLYKKIDWSYTYSFLILTSFYLLAHWFSRLNSFKKLEKNNVVLIIKLLKPNANLVKICCHEGNFYCCVKKDSKLKM